MEIIKAPFVPVKGIHASLHNPEDDTYSDVFIKLVRGDKAHVHPRNDRKLVDVVLKERLDYPLNPDINERFKYYHILLKDTIKGKIKAMFVSGEGGIGKTHELLTALAIEELQEGQDYNIIKGNATARALFDTLKEYPDKLTIFDDCDGVLKDATAGNILKAVLDSYAKRRVKWITAKGTESFDFTGSVIFLSNLNRDRVDKAVLSRTVMIDLYMTPEEKIYRMRTIADYLDLPLTLSAEEKEEVLSLIDKYKYTLTNLNLRTLIKALSLMETSRDISLVRYQILNG